jgi:hypothetical protein
VKKGEKRENIKKRQRKKEEERERKKRRKRRKKKKEIRNANTTMKRTPRDHSKIASLLNRSATYKIP